MSSPDSDLDELWRSELVKKHKTVRSFLPLLATAVEFQATPEGAPVLAALQTLPGLLGRKKVLPDEIDGGLLRGSWRRIVLTEDGTVNWRAYSLCVLEQFHRGLLHRDIHAVHSRKWSDPRQKLLSGEMWLRSKDRLLESLDLPEDPGQHLDDLAALLDGTYREVAARLPEHTTVSFDEEGRLHLGKLEAEPEPPSLVELRNLTGRMLPAVDLPEVLLEVAEWTGYADAFESITGGGFRLGDLEVSLAALLVAQACNTGLTPVVSSEVPALTRNRLQHVDQNYLRTETIKAANAVLIEAQAKIPLARLWGGGLVASIDGMRFVVPIATVHARPNPRYFGRSAGATWLNMVNDQASGLASKVVAGTPRDSLHVIDVLYAQDGGVPPDVLVTDTGSYSDTVFCFLTMAGRLYAPQLADIPDQKLWRIDRHADYGPFNTAARGQINLEKIRRHWPDMIRVIASIHAGTVRAHDVIRMLHRDGNRTALGDAIAHHGRIQKTLHILRLCGDEGYRRLIKAQGNLHEGRHSLGRKIFHGKRGELRQRYREGQEDQIGALGLVLNVVVLFNTRYLQAAVDELVRRGYELADEDIARLSPFVRAHVNTQGRYSFARPGLEGSLRTLNEPVADAIDAPSPT
jgi:TnpA family transposase